jgi:hypothetical protein
MKMSIIDKNSKLIIQKDLTPKDFEDFYNRFGYKESLDLVIALYKHFFELDIGSYNMTDLIKTDGELCVRIHDKDIPKIREFKIYSIFKD